MDKERKIMVKENTFFDYFQFIVNTLVAITAIIFAGLGIFLWKKQLKGGELYNYTKETLFELRKLLNLIDDFRYIFLTIEQENNMWSEIQTQFSKYESKMILVSILSNNKIDDIIKGKNIKYYLTIMYRNRIERNNISNREIRDEISDEEHEELSQRLLEIDKILKVRDEKKDEFGKELDEYFTLMCLKLRKYIK